jgi:hypothetical protein
MLAYAHGTNKSESLKVSAENKRSGELADVTMATFGEATNPIDGDTFAVSKKVNRADVADMLDDAPRGI